MVRHRQHGGRFLLLGGGFGAHEAIGGGWFELGSKQSGEVRVALLCDFEGKLGWMRTRDLEVLSVDDVYPGELLDGGHALDAPDE